MKKYIFPLLAVAILAISAGIYTIYHFISGSPWQGTWWGVQDAGVNWTGDRIQTLQTVTFTLNDDKSVTVVHKVQLGSKEIEGSLSGTGKIDGGRLVVTPKNGGKETTFSYHSVSKTIDMPLKNVDETAVTLKQLTEDNNDEMERIRSEIVQISQKPENKIDTTLSGART